jgi:hypothetical protein
MIFFALAAHIDHDARSHGPGKRYLVGRPLSLGKMKRGIHVSADVLGTTVLIGRIPITGRCPALADFFQMKRLRGGPVLRSFVKGISQIDKLFLIHCVCR